MAFWACFSNSRMIYFCFSCQLEFVRWWDTLNAATGAGSSQLLGQRASVAILCLPWATSDGWQICSGCRCCVHVAGLVFIVCCWWTGSWEIKQKSESRESIKSSHKMKSEHEKKLQWVAIIISLEYWDMPIWSVIERVRAHLRYIFSAVFLLHDIRFIWLIVPGGPGGPVI